jgi:hypothetical protein
MLHPLLRLFVDRPHWFAEHAQAYAELVAEEVGAVSAIWKRQAVLNAVALCGLVVTAVLAGVALMLWAVIPAAQIQAPWALIAAPLLPALLALGCLWAARRLGSPGGAFDSVRRQVQADMTLLREVSAA